MQKFYLSLLVVSTFLLVLTYFFYEPPVKESIIYFPLNERAEFLSAETTIGKPKEKGNSDFIIPVKSTSRLSEKAYLRQDITLLFSNGIFVGKFGKWEKDTDFLEDEARFTLKGGQLLQAISFHYGELHQGKTITSAQKMSQDFLYIIPTPMGLTYFRDADSEDETGFQEILDEKLDEAIKRNVQIAEEQFQLNLENYHIFPLSKLPDFETSPLPSLSKGKTREVIGQLWEGLYKNYFLTIKKGDGTTTSPIGSTMPIILFSKSKDHLYVIFQTADGEGIRLIQKIPH